MGRTSTIYKAVALSGAQANTAVWTPASGKAIHLQGYTLQLSTSGNIKLTQGNDAAGTRIVNITVTSNGGIDRDFPANAPIIFSADEVLRVTTTGSGDLSGTIFGLEV